MNNVRVPQPIDREREHCAYIRNLGGESSRATGVNFSILWVRSNLVASKKSIVKKYWNKIIMIPITCS